MCGVIGIIGSEDASFQVFQGLINLQHRGQDAAGICAYDEENEKFYLHKNKGLVAEVFSAEEQQRLFNLKSTLAIGHTRYSTVGTGDVSELQPMGHSHPFGLVAAHNGNIVNYFELKKQCEQKYLRQLMTNNDLEVIVSLLSEGFLQSLKDHQYQTVHDAFSVERLKRAVEFVLDQAHGGYSVVGFLGHYGMFAFRDRLGIRPLVLGKKGKAYAVSSETGALSFLDFSYERSLQPGELIFISKQGEFYSFDLNNNLKKQKKDQDVKAARPCMFEWVYFAGNESLIEDQSVYQVRSRLGDILGDKIKQNKLLGELDAEKTVVVPIPVTGRVAALSLSEKINIPYREVLIKNRYVHRSFILDGQLKREKAVELKLIPIKSEIQGKNIILVDDSIVRGTTSKHIVKMLQNAGAQDIFFVSTCPPIRYPCFYGIDFPHQEELVAAGKTIEDIAADIGVKQVIYLSSEELVMALGRTPCMSCLDGNYLFSSSFHENFQRNRKFQRKINKT